MSKRDTAIQVMREILQDGRYNIGPERIAQKYTELSRQPVTNPAKINNFPWGHPGFPACCRCGGAS